MPMWLVSQEGESLWAPGVIPNSGEEPVTWGSQTIEAYMFGLGVSLRHGETSFITTSGACVCGGENLCHPLDHWRCRKMQHQAPGQEGCHAHREGTVTWGRLVCGQVFRGQDSTWIWGHKCMKRKSSGYSHAIYLSFSFFARSRSLERVMFINWLCLGAV